MLVKVLFQLFHNFHVNTIVLRDVSANIKQIHTGSAENDMDTLPTMAGICIKSVSISIMCFPFALNVITLWDMDTNYVVIIQLCL